MLQKILQQLTSKYGDDVARNVFSNYGDDVAKRGAKSFIARELAGTSKAPNMIAYHSLPEEKLLDVINKTDDYFVNPSIQSVNPAVNMGGDFGEIAMIAKKDLVNSMKPGVNSYNRDIYSPRFPDITDDGLIAGTKKFASPNNLSDYMNRSAIKGSEHSLNTLNTGSLAGRKAKKFKNVRDIVENQGNIGEYGEVHNELNKYRDDISDLIGDMSKHSGEPGGLYNFSEAEADLLDMTKGMKPFYDYPDEIMGRYNLLMDRTKNLPTDYFETKLTRPVKMNEFAGVVLPDDFNNEAILRAFERNNIPIMGRYNPNAHINDMRQNSSLQEVLTKLTQGDRFKSPHILGVGGMLAGGGLLSGLLGGSDTPDNII